MGPSVTNAPLVAAPSRGAQSCAEREHSASHAKIQHGGGERYGWGGLGSCSGSAGGGACATGGPRGSRQRRRRRRRRRIATAAAVAVTGCRAGDDGSGTSRQRWSCRRGVAGAAAIESNGIGNGRDSRPGGECACAVKPSSFRGGSSQGGACGSTRDRDRRTTACAPARPP